MIRTCTVRLVCLALLAGGLLRVDLMAMEPAPATTLRFKDLAALKAKAADFDRRLGLLQQELEALKPRFEAFVAKIKEQTAALQAIATTPEGLSADIRARAERIRNGDEAAQTAALQGWQDLGQEGLVLAARTAEFTPHQAVRQAVLRQALELGEPGYGVIGLCYERLPVTDRTWLVETMTVEPTPDTLLAFLAMAKEAAPPVRQALIRASDTLGQAPLFVAALAHKADPAALDDLIPDLTELQGEDGLLLLYAVAAKGESQQRLAAAQAAAKRGEAGLVVLAGAFAAPVPAVRTEVVRALNAIGGTLAQEIIGRALQDPDEVLRAAAQEGLTPPPPALPAPAAE
jgi:hypothetical protein